MKSVRPSGQLSGFSLIWAAVGLTAAAMVMVSILPGKDTGGFNKKAANSIQRLSTVEQAMVGFMALNGRLPCPADAYDVNVHNFGIEAAFPGAATHCQGGTPAAPLGPDVGTGFVVGGVIPTKTLGLDDSYAFDEWGHRFTYLVDARATAKSGANSCANLTTGGIVIKKTNGGAVIANVMHAFIAYGPDGHGAWPMQGGSTPAQRINTHSQDPDKWINAGVDGSFTYNTTNFTNVLIRKEPTSTFSDVVYYADYLRKNCSVGGSSGSPPPVNCTTLWSATLNSGNTVPAYSVASVTAPSTCPAANTLSCANGVKGCTGGAEDPNCKFQTCTVNCTQPWGGTLNDGSTVHAYSTGSVNAPATCPAFNTLSCTAGTLSCSTNPVNPNCQFSACSVMAVCNLPWGGSIGNGATATAYSTATVPFGSTCTSEVRTCTNGTLSGSYTFSSCAVDPPANCTLPWGGTLNDSNSVSAYNTASVTSPATCPAANTLSCANGVLSCTVMPVNPNCQNQTCTVLPGTKLSGTRMDGATATDQTGASVAYGDINGDGIPDLIIGAPNAGYNAKAASGSVYVVYGTTSGFADPLALSGLNGTTGFRLDGDTAAYALGISVAAGDIDGDGKADIIIGANSAGYNALGTSGSVYVVLGGATGKMKDGTAWPANQQTSAAKPIDGTNGFRLDGDTAIYKIGSSVAAGDINADGFADIIIGSGSAGYNAKAASGSVWVVYGNAVAGVVKKKDATAWAANQKVSALVLANAFRLDGGTAGDNVGASLATGDINGDGKADIIIGASGTAYGAATGGSVYIVLGGPTGQMQDATAWAATQLLSAAKPINGTDGFRLDGPTATYRIGNSVAAGDINADGYADIIIGDSQGGYNAKATSGSVYVVLGGATGKMQDGTAWAATQALSAAKPINGTDGFRLDGATTTDTAGTSVAAADVNRDGYADIIIGAPAAGYSAGAAGSTYVVYGGATGKMEDGTAWAATQLISAAKPIDGTNGLRIDGQTAGDNSGYSVAAGDANGNGYPDILIGAYKGGYNAKATSGSVYLADGQSCTYAATNGLGTVVTAPAVCSPNTFAGGAVLDLTAGDSAGWSVATGDVNGDGYPDLIIGASAAGGGAGAVYVVFGTASGMPDPLPLSTLNGSNGFKLTGLAGDNAGQMVAAGDIDGDGKADIIIGAYNAGYNAKAGSGSVYVVYGGGGGKMKDGVTAWSTCPCALTSGGSVINATNGFRLDGATSPDGLGMSVATGDVNKDGKADIIIGAYDASYNAHATSGSVYVIYGGASGKMLDNTAWAANQQVTSGVAPINGTDGFRLDEPTAGGEAGYSVATGDINGDGYADIIIGALLDGYNALGGSGSVYVVYGGASGKMKDGTAWAATQMLTAASKPIDATNGFRLDGATTNEHAGDSVAAGDVNKDTSADIIIGANGSAYNALATSGSVYVVYGGPTMKSGAAWAATNLLTSGGTVITGTNGFRLDGDTATYHIGSQVAAGDLNGDGYADIITGAYWMGYNSKVHSGSVFVVFGAASGKMADGTAWAANQKLTIGSKPIDGTNGARFDGANATDAAGRSVAVGNLSNGTYSDLLIGASGYKAGVATGMVYIYPGHATPWISPYPLQDLCPGC
jgi:FG-GAP repeat